jgi:hypothetical protein
MTFSFEIILSTLSIFEFLKFKIQILKTTSDGKTINMKVVDLEKLWNFVVDDFSFKIILSMLSTFEFLKFKIQILKTTLDGKTINMKVVDLKKLWNFVVDNFFI